MKGFARSDKVAQVTRKYPVANYRHPKGTKQHKDSAKPKSLELTTEKIKQGIPQYIDCEHAIVQSKDSLFSVKNLEKGDH